MVNVKVFVPILVFLLIGCADETETVPDDCSVPVIAWDEPSARFNLQQGEVLTLVPVITGTDETTTYVWTRDDVIVGTEDHYTFEADSVGEFFIRLDVSNRCGTATDEAKITVKASATAALPDIPPADSTFAWRFPWTEINIARGRIVNITAAILRNAPDTLTYTWSFDGLDQQVITPTPTMVFIGQEGSHTISVSTTVCGQSYEQQFTVNVCPPEGTYRRPSTGQAMVNRIYEFIPAPGHQVNGYIIVGEAYPADCTHEQACDSVLAHFSRRWSVSLGSQGGYLVAGFDHSVPVSADDYDLCVRGNPFSYQSEPGIIWVSQDDNGDGLPNDQWFELAGSEYGTSRHRTNYAITYYRPAQPHSATAWRDCDGRTGYVPYMSYWNPSATYWQPWVEGEERTYFGSWLADISSYNLGISDIPPYDWGYVDNLGQDFIDGPAGKMGYYRVSNARTWDGQPANLKYFDFVKIQTAQIGSTPNLGDISTEIYYISDCHLE